MPGQLPEGPETPPEELPADYFAALGSVYMRYKQWSKAEEAYTTAYEKEKDPARRAPYAHALSQLHLRVKNHEKALPLLEEALRNLPETTSSYQVRQYRQSLARLYEQAKQFDKAEALYKKWLDEAKQDYERNLARRELLRFWQRTDKLAAAIEQYEATLKEKPDDKEALEALRLIYTSIQMDPEKALAVTEKLVAAQPDDRDAALQLVSAYERTRKYGKAIDLVKQLVAAKPEESDFLTTRLVHLYITNGQRDEALGLARDMLAAEEKTSSLHSRVASIYQRLQMIDEALAQYDAAAEKAKSASERQRYQLSAAHAARRAKKYEKAEALVGELMKSRSKAIIAQAKRLLFELYEEQNKLDQLQIEPEN